MVLVHLKKYFARRHRILTLGILCLLAVYVSASSYYQPSHYAQMQDNRTKRKPIVDTSKQKPTNGIKPKVIQMKSTDRLVKRLNSDIKVLIGNVILIHEGVHMYCDSAYLNEDKNTFEAFSRVHMVQGDTLLMDAKYMHYDGNTQLTRARNLVTLYHVPNETRLYTDSLDYDRLQNIGYYFNSGKLVDTINVLTSDWGQYEPGISLATFLDNVVLTNPNFTLETEKLEYSTESRVAKILEASKITSDSGLIFSSNGWYNTNTDKAVLYDQSKVLNKQGNRILQGDTIFYNKRAGTGEVFGNMQLQDTAQRVILRGHYGFYNEKTNYALATDSAYCIEYSKGDSLYLHADTLKLETILVPLRNKLPKTQTPIIDTDSLQEINPESMAMLPLDSLVVDLPIVDSLPARLPFDSLPMQVDNLLKPMQTLGKEIAHIESKIDTSAKEEARLIKAYHGARFYRSDLQGVADSMQFISLDSVLHLYREPILWNESNQISGDTIDIFMSDSTIRLLHVKVNAYSIEQKAIDSTLFNQVKGRSIKAFFEAGKLREVLVEGDAESVYYPEEKEGGIVGLNWLQSSYLRFLFKDNKLEKLVAWPSPKGDTTPLGLLDPKRKKLENFIWFDYLRPVDRHDIFRKIQKKATDVKQKRDAIFDRED